MERWVELQCKQDRSEDETILMNKIKLVIDRRRRRDLYFKMYCEALVGQLATLNHNPVLTLDLASDLCRTRQEFIDLPSDEEGEDVPNSRLF